MPENPAAAAAAPQAEQVVACAFCNSTDTELISLFGQFLLASQYYCRNCHSVFEAVRWTEETLGESAS